MTHTTTSNEKLHESLAQLNEAARNRREELDKLLAEKYTDLKSALGDVAGASASWLKEHGKEVGERAEVVAKTVDNSARHHPWYFIGGAALGGLLVGLLLNRHR